MKKLLLLTAVLSVTFLSGCAGVRQLNDPVLSKNELDVANLLRPREIPYETKTIDGVSVSYNLFYAPRGNMRGYRATLIFRNNTDKTITIEPKLFLKEANGFIIQPSSYNGFVQLSSALAGTAIPNTQSASGNSYYSNGTITSNTGERYAYTGTTTQNSGGFAGGLSSGIANGLAQAAVANQREGQMMLRWATSFWLKDSYTLPPKSAASGAIIYPASDIGQLPMQFNVSVAGKEYKFLTTSSASK